MYFDNDTIPEEDYFPTSKIFAENYRKMSTPGPVPIKLAWIKLHMFKNIMSYI